jgi:hypothetical protein
MRFVSSSVSQYFRGEVGFLSFALIRMPSPFGHRHARETL